MGNWRKKVPEQLHKKDDAVQLSGCGTHVVWARTLRLEGENRMWENTTEIYKMVFGFGRCTLGYMTLEETKRDKIRIGAGQKAMQYEERIRKLEREEERGNQNK